MSVKCQILTNDGVCLQGMLCDDGSKQTKPQAWLLHYAVTNPKLNELSLPGLRSHRDAQFPGRPDPKA